MPYTLRKVRGKNCYAVKAKSVKKGSKARTRRVFSKCTTKKKAKKQLRLLYALDNPGFVPR